MEVSDNFNRANEAPLASPYVSILGGGANLTSNAVTSTDSTTRLSGYSGAWGGSQRSEAIVGNLLDSTRYAIVGVMLSSAGGGRGYTAYTDGISGAGHTGISRLDAGSETEILAVSTTFAAGDKLGIRRDAATNTLYFQKNGSDIASVVDSTYTDGIPGLGAYGTATVDDWYATDGSAAIAQAGFRFHIDAAESSPSWLAAQNAGITRVAGNRVLVSFLLDATGSVGTRTLRLRHQINGAGGYQDTPVQ